ncbi:uncharacterized protein LOC105640283 isoform X2 [Jatropha curcas]|uniref:uncharacterized protein LOC105640283 isoform X2 n=1 Tax=Jatropha curcas TaxID=180498 RepID=UPI0009D72E0B|nr:uncharacterized protein LOC105640283 isoform X2 [Jatropha curcas]
MASSGRFLFSYQRLQRHGGLNEELDTDFPTFRRFNINGRRLKLRIPGLRRFLRKRPRLLHRVKVSWRKAWKRLKNGQAHINDLFGGNFMVMQCSQKTGMHVQPPQFFDCKARRLGYYEQGLHRQSQLSATSIRLGFPRHLVLVSISIA